MKVNRETWINPSKPSYAVFGEAGYISATEPRMIRQWSEENKSDRADVSFTEISEDNGRTWGKRKVLSVTHEEGGFTFLGGREGGIPFVDLDNNVTVLFSLEVVIEGEDVVSGLKRRRIFYSISKDGGGSFSSPIELVEQGEGYDTFHYMKDVYYGLNSASLGGKPIKISRDEILLPIYVAPLDENARLYNPLGGYTFTYAGFLIGKWRSTFSDLDWRSTPLVKIDPKRSIRGFSENTVVRLNDGRILSILRGSNSYKWFTLSHDNGRTWDEVEPLRFDDGEELFSPGSYSLLVRHSTGRLYWIANIVPTHPKGNSPRYPLCLAEIDEENVTIKRKTVFNIDVRDKGESEALQLSNFGLYEDRDTHEIVLTYPRLFAHDDQDWTAPCMLYRIGVEQ
jgi:hypothetical protein